MGGTRVSLSSVLTEFLRGATTEQIVQDFDALTLEDVYSVIAYYLKNLESVEAYLASKRDEAERLQQIATEQFPQAGIRQRLLARKAPPGNDGVVLRHLMDEDINGAITRELHRRLHGLELVRAEDVSLSSHPDSDILALAATAGRILLTHAR